MRPRYTTTISLVEIWAVEPRAAGSLPLALVRVQAGSRGVRHLGSSSSAVPSSIPHCLRIAMTATFRGRAQASPLTSWLALLVAAIGKVTSLGPSSGPALLPTIQDGPCNKEGSCVMSPNYPSNYGAGESCDITRGAKYKGRTPVRSLEAWQVVVGCRPLHETCFGALHGVPAYSVKRAGSRALS